MATPREGAAVTADSSSNNSRGGSWTEVRPTAATTRWTPFTGGSGAEGATESAAAVRRDFARKRIR